MYPFDRPGRYRAVTLWLVILYGAVGHDGKEVRGPAGGAGMFTYQGGLGW